MLTGHCSKNFLKVVSSTRSLTSRASSGNITYYASRHRQTSSQNAASLILQRRGYAEKVVKVPTMAESISEGTLKQWSKQIGDYVEQDEEIATIETDKIDVAVNSPDSGTIKEYLVNEEDTVTVGQDIAKIDTEGGSSGGENAKEQPKQPASEDKATLSDSSGKQPEEKAPSAPEKQGEPQRKLVDPPMPEASPSKQDSQSQKTPPSTSPAAQQSRSSQPLPKAQKTQKQEEPQKAAPGSRGERRVKMSRMRLRIAERLKQSQNTAASLTTFNEVDMSALMEFRKLYKDEILEKTGVKLGFMGAFSRACVLAMRDVPAVNASIEGPNGGDTIVYRDYVDISIAVATEKGLVTPVVRVTETMSLVDIEKAIAEVAKKARDNKLAIEDMEGGTFTISNSGVFKSLVGTPILNLPQTAVLGLYTIEEKAVVRSGKIEIRPMMWLALTYDHRLLDGREAGGFLYKVKRYIEDPRRMLL